MDFKQITFPNENISYVTPTWDEMEQLAFSISKKIIDSGEKFDRIVTLAKGGWPMTRSMVDFLQVDEVASIGVKFYAGINEKLLHPQIYQDLPVKLKGEKILLFDDVVDSGKSMTFVKEHLLKQGVKSITTASLFYKKISSYKPDYYGALTQDWIIFPYDAVSSIFILGKKWKKQGLTDSEITQRLTEMDISTKLVNFYKEEIK